MKAKDTTARIWALLKKNKYVLAVLLVGLVLILLPTGAPGKAEESPPQSAATAAGFALGEQESRIAAALSKIEGAGRVTVVLTLKSSTEQVLARDESEKSSAGREGENSMERQSTAVVVSTGSSTETPVTLKYIYPEYLGALVVSEGADNAQVKYQLVRAVAGLTGLGTDKITVSKMNKS